MALPLKLTHSFANLSLNEDVNFVKFLIQIETKEDLVELLEEKKKAKQKEEFFIAVLNQFLLAIDEEEEGVRPLKIGDLKPFAVE